MAYSDTIASKWFPQAQALSYMSSNWQALEPLLDRDDMDLHAAEYISILKEITEAGSVENCGGVQVLAHKYCISVSLAQSFIDDIKYIVTLYQDYLESQG